MNQEESRENKNKLLTNTTPAPSACNSKTQTRRRNKPSLHDNILNGSNFDQPINTLIALLRGFIAR
ncbi:unnamed protein product [Dovyalis caffra]|uniref:Uncharacterized protein n=1 Tax=Dovyalis caffra TaxID=77055 RepID=A0AAV1S109_9ROSI|nr:unnamed protein product [Dovyalis caffra]